MLSESSKPSTSVLFAHDGPLEVGPDGVPMGVHYTDSLLDRYFQLGSQLTFLMRSREASGDDASRYSPLVRSGFRFVPVSNLKGPIKRLIHGGDAVRKIRSQVESNDVVVVRLPSTIGRIAYWEAKRQGKPVLVEFMACTWDALWNYSWLGKVSAPYYFAVNRRLMRGANHVIYVTDEFLQRRYPTKGEAIACSNVVVKSGDKSVLERRIKRIGNIGKNGPVTLATVAAVDVRYKDQKAVFRALANLGPRASRFRYRVIGQGDPKRLVTLAKSYGVADLVEFVGPVRHSEIPRWLDDTDVYIQPSRMEGLPRALIEAMSRGCPSVGTTAGGIPELLPPGRIFNKGDYKALSVKLSQLTPQEMLKDAKENFKRAKDFDSVVLQDRRRRFFEKFQSDFALLDG